MRFGRLLDACASWWACAAGLTGRKHAPRNSAANKSLCPRPARPLSRTDARQGASICNAEQLATLIVVGKYIPTGVLFGEFRLALANLEVHRQYLAGLIAGFTLTLKSLSVLIK